MTLVEPIAVTLEVTAVLDQLGLRYAVGGSLASSVHGVPRSTEDIDLVVAVPGRLVDALVSALETAFYIDRDMIVDAIRRQASFNIIHLRTMYKVDIFIAGRSPLTQEELARRQAIELGDPPQMVYVCSPEDIVVQKLDWFRKGNELSERQWKDLVGVLKVQRDQLDIGYLGRWVRELGLLELAQRAFREAGIEAGL